MEFSQAARDRGIRIIADLVVNHTSIDHPWFQAARRDPKSKYRNWYVWSKEKPPNAEQGMVFPGVQKTTWTFDETAGEYYYHRFYDHQPDLNTGNPEVRAEIEKIIKTWLQLGVSGFRVDALPFVITTKGPGSTAFGDCPEYLVEMRQVLSWGRGDAVFMAEANLPPDQVPMYFGEGDRVHVIFNFYVNQHLWLALAREQAQPIRDAYAALPQIPKYCQWANFLRTHDELDLGRLSDDERREVFDKFGPEPRMQLYNRGIRRRTAPMLGNDRRRLELAHSLILTLPGTPVLRNGDEIGMGENLDLQERDAIRTPMQWANAKNGGFSPAERIVLPVISGGEFGYEKVNVAARAARSGVVSELDGADDEVAAAVAGVRHVTVRMVGGERSGGAGALLPRRKVERLRGAQPERAGGGDDGRAGAKGGGAVRSAEELRGPGGWGRPAAVPTGAVRISVDAGGARVGEPGGGNRLGGRRGSAGEPTNCGPRFTFRPSPSGSRN